MKELKKRFLLMVTGAGAVVIAVVAITVAWYTKMTAVSGMEFTIAQWDYSAQHQMDDIIVNVNTYSELNGLKAAPGVGGTLSVNFSAEDSETDVNYSVTVDKSGMSAEFQKRIYFYADAAMTQLITATQNMTGTVEAGESTLITVYWRWVYDYTEVPAGVTVTEEEQAAWDDYDTAAGKNPELYQKYMNARLLLASSQPQPGDD